MFYVQLESSLIQKYLIINQLQKLKVNNTFCHVWINIMKYIGVLYILKPQSNIKFISKTTTHIDLYLCAEQVVSCITMLIK